MFKIIIIGTGGFAGAVLRYFVSLLITRSFPQSYIPLGTLGVNIIGSFLMGLGNGYISFHADLPENLRFLILVGFLGAFTTYSTFSMEAFTLMKDNGFLQMFTYIFLHLTVGLGAVMSGFYLMRLI